MVLAKKYKTKASVGNLNNHIGVPLSILSINDACEIAIIEMGANQESLGHPRAHAEIEAVFKHLVGSLKVERLTP